MLTFVLWPTIWEQFRKNLKLKMAYGESFLRCKEQSFRKLIFLFYTENKKNQEEIPPVLGGMIESFGYFQLNFQSISCGLLHILK